MRQSRLAFRWKQNASLPGLTRQSILLKGLFFSMDARVKPAHDDSE
jgi:hypothetical protein